MFSNCRTSLGVIREIAKENLGFHHRNNTSGKMGSCHWQCSQMVKSGIYSTVYFGDFTYYRELGSCTRRENESNSLPLHPDGRHSYFGFSSRHFTWSWKALWNTARANIKKEGNGNTQPTSPIKVTTSSRQPKDKKDTDMIYVVSYLLNPKRDATNLLTELQRPPRGWCHYLDDTWLIATNETANELYNRLLPYLIPSDYILIIQMKPDADYFGYLPNDTWTWIQDNMDSTCS